MCKQNKNSSLISIVIPTYNRGSLIHDTLNSVVNQSYNNWECLIIDDGSTDNTIEVLQPYLKHDQRFKLYSRSSDHKKGPSGCRNQGIDLSKGEYIIFFDSDDIVHPDNLKICLDILDSHKEFSYCRYDKKPFKGDWQSREFEKKEDLKISPVSLKVIHKIVTNELPFACCTVMWRRKVLGEMRFNEKLSYAEEWEYYIRILVKGIKGASLNTELYYNRKHSNSNTGQFWAYNAERRRSNIAAVLKTIETLHLNNLLNAYLNKYFMRLGFFLNSSEVLQKTLVYSEKGVIYKCKYLVGFYLYPVLKPMFRLKERFLKKIKN